VLLHPYLQTICLSNSTVEWRDSRTYWPGENTKKCYFFVGCLKRYMVQFLNIFSANKFAVLCFSGCCIMFVKLCYWNYSGYWGPQYFPREPHVGQPWLTHSFNYYKYYPRIRCCSGRNKNTCKWYVLPYILVILQYRKCTYNRHRDVIRNHKRHVVMGPKVSGYWVTFVSMQW
jgi:hypothetical protein